MGSGLAGRSLGRIGSPGGGGRISGLRRARDRGRVRWRRPDRFEGAKALAEGGGLGEHPIREARPRRSLVLRNTCVDFLRRVRIPCPCGPDRRTALPWASIESSNHLNIWIIPRCNPSRRMIRKLSVNARQFQRWLRKHHGCTFHSHKGGSGHLTIRRGDRTSQLPMHGSRRELGTKLIEKIKKDLGLK